MSCDWPPDPDALKGVSCQTAPQEGQRSVTHALCPWPNRSRRRTCSVSRPNRASIGRAVSAGLERVIAPVRPSLKTRYPLTPMENFARWNRGDGLHLDPWVRTHQRLGATILGPAADSMVISARWRSGSSGPGWRSLRPGVTSFPRHWISSTSTGRRTPAGTPSPACGRATGSPQASAAVTGRNRLAAGRAGSARLGCRD
jgi:hypothetical protein